MIVRSLPEVRVFVDGSGNMGHQASGLFIIDRLIKRYDYQGEFTIVFDEGDAIRGKTLEKLATLLGDSLVYSGVSSALNGKLKFLPYAARRRLPNAAIGLSGGADYAPATNLCSELRVDAFLCVQPYLWSAYPSYLGLPDGTVQMLTESSDCAFSELPAYVDAVDSPPDWERFVVRGDKAVRESVRTVQAILGSRERAPIGVVYGMRDESNSGANSQDIFAAYIASLLVALRRTETTAILVHCGTPVAVMKVVQAIIGGAEMPIALNAYNTRLYFSGSRTPRAAIADDVMRMRSAIDRARFFASEEGAHRVRFETTLPHKEPIRWLHQEPGRLLIVGLERLPLECMAHLFRVASVPALFEGQASASIAVSAGNPYLQIIDAARAVDALYPAHPERYDIVRATKRAQAAGDALISAANATIPFVPAIEKVAGFCEDAILGEPGLTQAFGALREYFKVTGRDRIDRGLVELEEMLTER
jgi:hypothetical protein